MKILHRYLSHEIIGSTLLLLGGLLALFAFFDLAREMGDLGKSNYRLGDILLYVGLLLPGHVYELMPIAALIGTMFALARLVAHSEFTVMRVSGISGMRIAGSILLTGLLFVVVTFVFGEFIAPNTERVARQLRTKAMSSVVAQEFRSGLWVKDGTSFVNVKEILPDATLVGLRIYQFDSSYHLQTISFAERGEYRQNNSWHLDRMVQTRFDEGRTSVRVVPDANWNSVLNPGILSVLLVVPEQMSAWNLYSYTQHLRENHQKTSRYEIALWSKLSYPLAVLVMMLLALPFAYHHSRAGSVSTKLFAGIMLGLGFHLSNRLFSHMGLLNDWPPLFSAIFPALLFLFAAIGLMWRVERR
jgi:lipopolysaccharide export system permease protein